MMYTRLLYGLVKIAYLVFYLVSPFFHHHHDELIQVEVRMSYHSHLFNGTEEGKEDTEYHHTFENDDPHNHSFLVRGVVTNLTQSFADTFLKNLPVCISIEPKLGNNSSWNNYTVDFGRGHVHRDKCVFVASNVSPPFVLTA